MPVLNSAVAPVIVIAPRGTMARAISDDHVVADKALGLRPAYKHGPKHRASARDVNLEAHARNMMASGGGKIDEMQRIRMKYRDIQS